MIFLKLRGKNLPAALFLFFQKLKIYPIFYHVALFVYISTARNKKIGLDIL
jgi:hypothetical protein